MKIFYTDHYVLPLPEGHRFPMRKYALLRQRVSEAGLGSALVDPPAATDMEILRAHGAAYLERVKNRRAIGRGDALHRIPLDTGDGGALAPVERRDRSRRVAQRWKTE